MDSAPLHTSSVYVHCLLVNFNRCYTIIHSLAICIFLYYRATSLFRNAVVHVIPWLLAATSELLLSLIWMLLQPFHWRPIRRQVFPERLPPDDQLPGLDVFVFTADPDKEPTVGVVNTVLSAMALDYPPEKLHVYLSDDGGADVTLVGLQEAWKFARDWWLPFCRKFRVKTRSPEIYFYGVDEEYEFYGNSTISHEFEEQRGMIKEAYEEVKERIKKARHATTPNRGDHPPVVRVIKDINSDEEVEAKPVQMPLLIYVSREKRPSYPHHFKAGAINVLLRVSGVLSNSPYILMLDCDMSCNDPTSARQAMCFHLDPTISPTLSFVQFPQCFRGISQNDIYDAEIRVVFKIWWCGMDGITGPILSGSNFYIKRESLYRSSKKNGKEELYGCFGDSSELTGSLYGSSKKNGKEELYCCFGDSSELIGSLLQSGKMDVEENSSKLLTKAHKLASCAYEDHTKWGEEVGFRYFSVVEDFFTSFTSLHCNGWKSVYLDPTRPAFLGSPTTTLNDMLVQGIRWTSGLGEVAFSRFSPLVYGPSRRATLLASICYQGLALFPLLYCLSLWVFATIPPLCLLHGIPLYPEVSDPFFLVASFIFFSALSKHILETLISGGSLQNVINEQRIWLIKAVTSQTYGMLDVAMKKLNLREASFLPTNKVDDDEQLRRYQDGVFDFQTSTMFLAPLVGLVFLNALSYSVGLVRVAVKYDVWEKMLLQVFLSFYVLVLGYPIIEGALLRKDKGRIKPKVTLISAALMVVFLVLGSLALSR